MEVTTRWKLLPGLFLLLFLWLSDNFKRQPSLSSSPLPITHSRQLGPAPSQHVPAPSQYVPVATPAVSGLTTILGAQPAANRVCSLFVPSSSGQCFSQITFPLGYSWFLIRPFTAAILSEVNETFEAGTVMRRFCLLGSSLLLAEALRWMFHTLLHERENENESSRSGVMFLSLPMSSNPQAGARVVLLWAGAGGMGKDMGQRGDRPSFEGEHPSLCILQMSWSTEHILYFYFTFKLLCFHFLT